MAVTNIRVIVFVEHNVFQLPVSLSFAELFWNIWEVGAKKYFIDNQTANTIQLFVAIKGHCSGLFYFCGVAAKKNSPDST